MDTQQQLNGFYWSFMKISKIALFLGLLATIKAGIAQEFLPSAIYQLDEKFSHHAIIVEKSTHQLYLYKYEDGISPKLVKRYQIATGKIKGDKDIQGDKKTPEGIYYFQRFFSAESLISKYGDYGLIYGVGAFTLNYPNEIDRRAGKTGGGIWLHSTDDDERVSKGLDSKGCVVAVESDLKEISQYIDLSNTPTIIVQDLHFLEKKTWQQNKDEILLSINTWMSAWQNKNFKSYINSYSKNEFIHARKGNYSKYKSYKKIIFSRAEKPTIEFRNISVLSNQGYAVVTLVQDYNSEYIKDIGKKTIYLKKDANYEWKIIAELFNKIDRNDNNSFTPSMRFFTNNVTKNN
jgi:murein L,D-transpeptidase YafK